MNYGLLERDLMWIRKALARYPEIKETVIFGSRAMGNYKRASNVDLVIKGKNVTRKVVNRLRNDLNEKYPLPYFFDVVYYDHIANQELKKHIDTEGKVILKC